MIALGFYVQDTSGTYIPGITHVGYHLALNTHSEQAEHRSEGEDLRGGSCRVNLE